MEAEQRDFSRMNENVISQLWEKYVPYWPVFLLLAALAVGAAWFCLQHKLPVYESTATLLIKDEKKGIEDAKMIESLNLLSGKKIIENEVEVIKSRALMSQVVKELKLYAPVYEKGKWKDLPAYTFSPLTIEAQSPDSIIEVAGVDFSYEAATQKVVVNGLVCALDNWVLTPWGTLRFSLNNKAYRYKAPLYFALLNPKRVTQNLISRVDVSSAGKLSSVVNLKLKDEVPRRSEDILNTLLATYDKAAVNDKNALSTNTLSFLDERLKFVTADLDSIEKALQQYKAGRGAINISTQGQLFLQNVSANDQKLSEVNMKLSVLNQVEQNIFSNSNGLVPTTLGMDEPVLSNLLNKLYELELQAEKMKGTTGENNPEALAVADQIQKIKPGILENIRSQKRSLELSKANLYATNSGYNSLLSALPQQERDLLEISREQNIKSSIYSFLLQRREEAALSHSATVSDSRIVDRAESTLDPVGVGNKFVYCLAILLALCLGIVWIAARELFNRSVLFRHEVEALTTFPVIGEVSAVKLKSPLVIQDGKTSLIAEQFRLLRTSLPYLGINGRGKKILITSTMPGEGKSFVASNLAHSLAIGNKKVILVEFDLSNPTLGEKLGTSAAKGVADYLAGDVAPGELIKRAGKNPCLFLMAAGSLPVNPSELILSARTGELLNHLQEIFDYVIIDSAPVGLLSDGYVLARHCDATLYIVRHGFTPKRVLERLERNNKITELKNIGLVFNGVRTRGFGNNNYGYGYGYPAKQKMKISFPR